jgi:PKD repeat protein
MSVVENNGEWIGFAVTRDNLLLRISFGDSPANSNYTITSLGNPGGLLNLPDWIHVIASNGKWYGLVTNQTNEIIRLVWTDLTTTPVAQSLNLSATGKLNAPAQVEIELDGNEYVAVVANSGSNRLTLINFGESLDNNPDNDDVILSPTFDGIVNMFGVTAKQVCGEWTIYTSVTDRMYKVNVGSSLFEEINASQIVEFTSDIPVQVGSYVRLKSVVEGGDTYVYFTSYTSNIFSAFIWRAAATNAEYKDLTTLTVPGQLYNLEIYHDDNSYGFFIGSFNTGAIRHIEIDYPCAVNPSATSSDFNPQAVSFSSSGIFLITLSVQFADGFTCSTKKEIIVNAAIAPDINFSNQNVCANNDVFFTYFNLSGDINEYDWDFGDASTSSQANPSHQYSSAGEYLVQLNVKATNGCKNFNSKTIKIHNPPAAAFTMPPGLLCTNNELKFETTTPDNYDGNLLYQWYAEDVPVSTARDLLHTFTVDGVKEIKLKTSIPGCSDETAQSISDIKIGPVIDFTFSGQCEDSAVLFSSVVPETVISYNWNFSVGPSSTDKNPSHTFSNAGTYSVQLTGASSNGCNNSKTKPVTIYTKPSVDFKIDPPPLSCSGSETAFKDLTIDPNDSDLQFWQWNFGDAGAGNTAAIQNPSHTYANAGTYTVSLTAATNAGCSASWEEQISISQSPAVTIDNSPTCVGVPVNFSAIGSDIKSYYWEMGTLYYEIANPVHTFNAAGNQPLKLTIQGNNNCITVYNRSATVPAVLSPDFSVIDNCTGHDAVFTDITTGADPVIQRTWDFAGLGTSSDQPASFEFASIGNKNIKLTVTTQAGCSYIKNKTISVIVPPIAGFTASPESGGTPLFVQFTNTSAGATNYTWSIDEGSVFTTNVVSPSYTFTQVGSFLVTLAASGPQGCASLIVKEINTTAGLPDVDLKLITTAENADGTMKVIITVQNKGNTILRNLPVVIDISGHVSLSETIAGPIGLASMYNLVLSYGLIPDDDLKFLCAEATLENDQTPAGNRICKELDSGVFLFNAYPNPAKGELTIEWIAPKDEVITISLVDSSGKKIVLSEVSSVEGLNSSRLSLDNIKNGLYILRIQGASLLKTQRIFVSGQN